ncbi:MAG: LCP family protein, partial [Bacilli bacterium]|nr:LCP family protein [Bacilli bacterium]
EKYTIVFSILLVLINIIILIKLLSRIGWVERIITLIISLFLIIGMIISIIYINNTYKFIDSLKLKDKSVITYSVITLKENNYTIKKLKNKNIGYIKDENYKLIEPKINIDYKQNLYEDYSNIPEDLLNKKVDAIILEESYLQISNEEIENFKEQTEVIYTFDIIVKEKESTNDSLTTKEPFIMYISGIDTYGKITNRSRSDVNILLVVNPKTNKVLLVNTPRDYYVQLDNTNGLKDKLTHAGIYGIDKSIKTIENLYDINIDNYLRVNFNTLVKIVDVIGGIEVYSDRAFRPWTNNKIFIEKGINYFNGEKALAFARERKSYENGDNKRGQNQQLVIEAIIKKVTTSKVLLTKYNNILSSLTNSFQTDMSINTIKDFLKYQLDKMPNWEIDSIQATGYDSYNYTYSMGYNYLLYVMEPNNESIKSIKQRINSIIN